MDVVDVPCVERVVPTSLLDTRVAPTAETRPQPRDHSQADAVLTWATHVFPEVFPALDGLFADDARVVHVDLDA